jgi:predicted membrane protein
MNSYTILFLYTLIFFLTIIFFHKLWKKNIFASILAGLIVAQLVLIFLSFFGIFAQTDDGNVSSASTELIFWAINLITPFLIYGSLLYIIYTRDL